MLRNTADVQLHDVWELTAATLLGYQRHRLLTPAEVDVLGDLVLARLGLTLAIAARRVVTEVDNIDYIGQYDDRTRVVLAQWCDDGPDAAHGPVAPDGRHQPTRVVDRPTSSNADCRAMGGPLAPLFYDEPLEIVRGEGPWLIAADGTRYLDAYNNVAVIGHAHPAVTQAVSRQLAALNTHSRYLHPRIVELAERLLATVPAGLDTCLFTTSGTEANELAWRMATAHTGGNAAIVAEHAYHGSSTWMADLSSNEWPAGYRPAHVATFAAPTAGDRRHRPRDRPCPHRGCRRRPGPRRATVRHSSWPTSVSPARASSTLLPSSSPDSSTAPTGPAPCSSPTRSSRASAAVGPQLWRFAAAGITPDFVTLGKPMGAGYPIGAVITRREIADSLARDYEYFSTFAATPVAAAAASVVLDVLGSNRLPESAMRVGAHLRGRLRELAGGSSVLGEVRGVGLLAGIDLVAPGSVDPRLRHDRARRSRRPGVLAGLTGPTATVLKVRPPLVWEEHARRCPSGGPGLARRRLDPGLLGQRCCHSGLAA